MPRRTRFGTMVMVIIPHWGTNFARICLSRDFRSRRAHLGLRWTDDDLYGNGDRAADLWPTRTAAINYVTIKKRPRPTSRLTHQRRNFAIPPSFTTSSPR